MEYVINSASYGRMAELVDASVLGTDIERCVGSSPISPTKNVDKSVYSVIDDKSTLSTIVTMESVVYKENNSVVVLGTSIARCEGSSPFSPTNKLKKL
jgi:hypothetical protein